MKGGAFVRYRVEDMIKCLSLKDETYNISIPQIVFVDRLENIIDLTGFTCITSTTINKAIALSKYNITHWVACKEFLDNEPILHIYLETDPFIEHANELKTILSHALNVIDPDFKSIKDLLSRDPLKVTVLKSGTFKDYMKRNNSLNVINPDKQVIDLLMEISHQK